MSAGRELHILHVVGQLGSGGMEMAMARVIASPALADMSHSVVCLRGRDENDFGPGVSVHYMQSRSRDPGLPWRLAKLIRKLSPTIIHARNWHAWADTAVARWLLGGWGKFIYSFHGLSDASEPWRRRIVQWLLARSTDYLFTVSQPSRRLLASATGVPVARIGLIPNGVNTEVFSPSESPPANARPIIGTVGNLTPVKNHSVLVEALALLLDRGMDAQLQIAGEGERLDDLRRLALKRSVAHRLKLCGYVRDVPAFLRQLDVFVLPSLSEAHPNALLEAMSCGRACVASPVGGVPDVLDHGQAGLVAAADPPTLAEAIARLLQDPALRQSLGDRARQRVCQCYSVEQMARAYEQMYRSVSQS